MENFPPGQSWFRLGGESKRRINENLCRAELTPVQRAAAIRRRKQIWEALHPEGVSAQFAPKPQGGETVPTLGGEQEVGFAADTCAAAGLGAQAQEAAAWALIPLHLMPEHHRSL
ncbi:MAG TPA: hypothetical protein PKH90_13035 [Candidatus Desulfobacillus denitrificans]|nr:hypothetical protein [Candidatus Desulfobacillus denitrificans]